MVVEGVRITSGPAGLDLMETFSIPYNHVFPEIRTRARKYGNVPRNERAQLGSVRRGPLIISVTRGSHILMSIVYKNKRTRPRIKALP